MAVTHDRSLGARFAALAYDAYGAAMNTASVEAASNAGAAVVRALGPLTPTHQIARTNIRFAFPDLSPKAEAALLDEMWDNLGRTFGEFSHLHRMDVYSPGARIDVVGAERLDAVRDSKKGAILISGHFANWEVMAIAIVQRPTPCRVTYRPAKNYFIDQRIIAQRAAYGVRLQAAKGRTGGMSLMRALAEGDSVALLNDQKYNEGVEAPFFGRPAMTADGPTRLARRFDCPLIPMSVKRRPRARFRVTVHEPIPRDPDPDEETAVRNTVMRINQFVEDRVREEPAQWFWVHRRWPKPLYKRAKR